MTPLRWIAVALLILIVAPFLFLAQVSPEWEITSGAKPVPAPAARIVEYLSHLEEWQTWALPEGVDGKWTYSDPSHGVGATFTFSSERAGERTLELTAIDEISGSTVVRYVLGVGGDAAPVEGSFTVTPNGAECTVEWVIQGVVPDGPLRGLMSIATRLQGSKDLERGINSLADLFKTGAVSSEVGAPLERRAPKGE